MVRHVMVVAAAFGILLVTQMAAAQERVIARHVDVSVGDLNLDTVVGQTTLSARIDSAARQACGGSVAFDSNYRDAPNYVSQSFAACRKTAALKAYRDLGMAPRFAAVH